MDQPGVVGRQPGRDQMGLVLFIRIDSWFYGAADTTGDLQLDLFWLTTPAIHGETAHQERHGQGYEKESMAHRIRLLA
jgi:hypothetical protein